MPAPAKIALLPEDVRQALDQRLVGNAFSDYHALAAWLAEQGYEIGKSAIHNYGQGLKRKLAAIKASTEAARLIAESSPDDEDRRSEAVMSLLQSEMFTVLVNLQDAEDEEEDSAARVKLLSTAARATAALSRASVNQKKWAQDVRNRAEAAAAAVDTIARKGGLSADTAAAIRREILGIAA